MTGSFSGKTISSEKERQRESYELANNENTECNEVADKNIRIYVDDVPMASCIVQLFQKKENRRPFIVLFDSGSSHTFWNIKSLPKGCVPLKVDAVQSSTLAGPMQSQLEVTLEHIVFPEFFRTRQVREVQAKVFNADCRYDAIIGRDMLKEMGLIIDFKDLRMTWDDVHVPM